jgi:hypothetical protein
LQAKRERERLWLRGAWVSGCTLVALGSLLPGEAAPVLWLTRYLGDKVLHFSAYAVLALLPVLRESRRWAVLCVAAVLALGMALEWAQHFVSGRFSEAADLAANSAGIALGALLGLVFRGAKSG